MSCTICMENNRRAFNRWVSSRELLSEVDIYNGMYRDCAVDGTVDFCISHSGKVDEDIYILESRMPCDTNLESETYVVNDIIVPDAAIEPRSRLVDGEYNGWLHFDTMHTEGGTKYSEVYHNRGSSYDVLTSNIGVFTLKEGSSVYVEVKNVSRTASDIHFHFIAVPRSAYEKAQQLPDC